MGRLTRLGCWQAGELAGLAEGRHQGPRQKLQNWQIIAGLVAQCLHTGGSLQHLIRRYFAVRLSSSALSQQLWERLPPESLMILDRYYGQAPMLGELLPQCEARSSHFLVRVREKLNVKVQQPHADGSATVAVALREAASAAEPANEPPAKPVRACGRPRKHPAPKVSELKVREVRGRVLRSSDGKWVEVRLWTSLSPQQASAEQLLELYARRWEQEIFYKELKLQINQGDLLAGQRTETAQQQVAAMMIACSLLAEERLAVAGSCEDEEVRRAGAVRISFSLCQEYTVALWMVLEASQGLMDAETQGELVRRVRSQIAAAALPPRRSRSCQRKVRRPIDQWPRMLTPTSLPASKLFSVSTIA